MNLPTSALTLSAVSIDVQRINEAATIGSDGLHGCEINGPNAGQDVPLGS